jgi:hypothetical protein
MFCPVCGVKIPAESSYCLSCGAKVLRESTASASTPNRVPASLVPAHQYPTILDGCISLIVLGLIVMGLLTGTGFVQAALSSGAVGLGMWIYFIPARIAFKRSKKQRNPIAVLNLLLGWTILGWVGALVWATSSE